jgi:hypothetical protein
MGGWLQVLPQGGGDVPPRSDISDDFFSRTIQIDVR